MALHTCRYVTVDVTADRNLFYTLAENTEDPDAPLLLWLNG